MRVTALFRNCICGKAHTKPQHITHSFKDYKDPQPSPPPKSIRCEHKQTLHIEIETKTKEFDWVVQISQFNMMKGMFCKAMV